MDEARLKAHVGELVQHLVEQLVLRARALFVLRVGVRREHADDGEILHIFENAGDFVRLLGEKTVPAEACVNLNLHLGDGLARLGDAVYRNGGVVGADADDDAELKELFQLLRVGGAAEHHDFLVRKAGVPEPVCIPRVADGVILCMPSLRRSFAISRRPSPYALALKSA